MARQLQSFEDLVMWQKSHALTLRTYRLDHNVPKHETLRARLRRCGGRRFLSRPTLRRDSRSAAERIKRDT